jgi:hypothetical protein
MAPAPPPVLLDGGTPAGLANAFTATRSTRPVPADFGPLPQVENAFQDAGAAFRPLPAQVAQPPAPPGPGAAPPPMPGPGRSGLAPVGTYLPPAVPPSPAVTDNEREPVLKVLHEALLPSERELAAERLSGGDWRREPAVVEALVRAARTDPAPTVRAACVRVLARLRANTPPVVAAVQGLTADADPRVRQAAAEALPELRAP